MSYELLIGFGGLILSVLTYFAGVLRTQARYRAEDSDGRINRVLSSYLDLLSIARTSGLDGLIKAGVSTLETDAEIRTVGKLIQAHVRSDPLNCEPEILRNVDLKKFFDYATKTKVNFFDAKLSEIIEKSESSKH